jgi:plastocyanin
VLLTPLRSALVVAALSVVAFGGGCGGRTPSATASSAAPTAAGSPEPSPAVTVRAEQVTATLTDYKIALSEESFKVGTYTFTVTQKGAHPHSLSIKGPGVEQASPMIAPGGPPQSLTVTLQPGTYVLWCPVGDHRQRGMEATITVM